MELKISELLKLIVSVATFAIICSLGNAFLIIAGVVVLIFVLFQLPFVKINIMQSYKITQLSIKCIIAIAYFFCFETTFRQQIIGTFDNISKSRHEEGNHTVTEGPSPSSTAVLAKMSRLLPFAKVPNQNGSRVIENPLVYTFAQSIMVVCETAKYTLKQKPKVGEKTWKTFVKLVLSELCIGIFDFIECYITDLYFMGAKYFGTLFLAQSIYVAMVPPIFIGNKVVGYHLLNTTFITILISIFTFPFVKATAFDITVEVVFIISFLLTTALQIYLHIDSGSPKYNAMKTSYFSLTQTFQIYSTEDYLFAPFCVYVAVWIIRAEVMLWSIHPSIPIVIIIVVWVAALVFLHACCSKECCIACSHCNCRCGCCCARCRPSPESAYQWL